MHIRVNGEEVVFAENQVTVTELLQRFSLAGRPVMVERNREIVLKPQYGETLLADGDVVEIVQFVGGG